MLATFGRILILTALGLAAAGAITGYTAGRTGSPQGARITKWLAGLFAACLVGANALMVYALLVRDFTVGYVDQVGSHEVPDYIAVVSLWSSLEGSILFWGAILGGYVLVFLATTARKHEYRDLMPFTLATILVVGAFFAFMLAGPANPFLTIATPKEFHVGPNPLLQNHVLMIIHPPMLYFGYVGMTIPFAMGVAALLRGRLGAGWMKPMRLWMLFPWGTLTLGIVLGGWWAYEVLGWGGYWAWDPVENASFLPWLTATGFLHAAMLMERRGLLKAWTLVLLLSTFCLTILGTFMTRSGVFNSVHSFTQSPIGPLFFFFLAVVMVFCVLLFGFRMHLLGEDGEFKSALSRDAMFVVNNLLFVAFTFTVLIGTTFPLIREAIIGDKITVGEPYFNAMTVPIGVAIVFLMGIGPALPWGRASREEAMRILVLPLGAGLGLTVLGAAIGARDFWTLITLLAAGFAATVSLRDMLVPVGALRRRKGLALGAALATAFQRGRRRYGGQIVHLGVALMAVSIAVSSSYRTTDEAVVNKGESMTIGDYTLTFVGTTRIEEEHRDAVGATMAIRRGTEDLGTLEPRMNRYRGQARPIGTPAVLSLPHEDLYLSAMQIDDRGAFVGLRVYVNPMVYWIWIATGVMILGCLISAWPARRVRHA
ncbi:MAG: heme lyase CcmF/NrfE family subunit [Proteobacteria bacterium]|nr:heme lyase CcmF/NrfE family subunit [Pseudomonadota bacterium]